MTIQWTKPQEQKPETNGAGRLDDSFRGPDVAIEDLELAAHALALNEHKRTWTLGDLMKLRRTVSKLDAVGSRIERGLERGPYPTGTGVSGA